MRLGIILLCSFGIASAQDSTVVLGGTGPPPYFEQAIDKISDALTATGVKVKVLAGDARARTALLEEMKTPGYDNLLYVTLHSPRGNPSDASRGDVTAECLVGGRKVWEEKSKGPLVLPGSQEHEVGSMLNGIAKKVAKRAGGPCLPR